MSVGRFTPPSSSNYTRYTINSGTSYIVLPDKRGRSDVDVNPVIFVGLTHETLVGKTVAVRQTLCPREMVVQAIANGTAADLIWHALEPTHDLEADGAVLLQVQPMVTAIEIVATGGDLRVEVAI